MAWTTPRTWTTGEIVTAAQLNAHVRDNLNRLRSVPQCRVYNNAAISIPNNVGTALTFNSERYDSDGIHSTVTNTGRLTIPTGEDGLWAVGANVQWAGTVGNSRIIYLTHSTGGIFAYQWGPGTSVIQNVNGMWPAVAGSYFTVTVEQDSGVALNVSAGAAFSPEFWAARIG